MERADLPAIDDALDAITGIEQATAGKTLEEFQSNWLLRRGVDCGIEIISEPSRRVPAALKSTRPEVPWRDVETIGNILRHEYHTVSSPIIWDVVQTDLPQLRSAIEAMSRDRT